MLLLCDVAIGARYFLLHRSGCREVRSPPRWHYFGSMLPFPSLSPCLLTLFRSHIHPPVVLPIAMFPLCICLLLLSPGFTFMSRIDIVQSGTKTYDLTRERVRSETCKMRLRGTGIT